ncbi:hypothetical protein LTR85_005670 [Meristemomyces frigidus]|nr:hypothetical protein LTR85_005670 [Meristemomyces frigidus]
MSLQEIVVVRSASISTQPWWPDLHSAIITAFKRKDIQAFPPAWTRLNPDPTIGAEGLAKELGPYGQLVVVLENGTPIACSGVLPFRGEDWTKEVRSVSSDAQLANGEVTKPNLHPQAQRVDGVIADWEICCFCVHPSYRGRGLARLLLDTIMSTIKLRGAGKLIANYSIEETGDFWPRMGFTQPIGTGSVLKKGFTHTPGMEGLRDDIHFKMSANIAD